MSNYTTIITNDTPQAYYRLDETSGTNAADSSGNSNAGTYSGSGYTLNSPGCLTGDADAAVLFTTSSGKVTLPTGLNGNGLNALSVECWVIPTTTGPGVGNFYILVNGPQSGNTGYQFYVNYPPTLNFVVGNGSATATALSAPNPFVAGSVYHLVGTYDGTNARLYVNGVLQGTSGTLAGPISNSGAPTISVATSLFFPGTIDEVGIYIYAMTPAKVLSHYIAGRGGMTTTTRATFGIRTAIVTPARAAFQIANSIKAITRILFRIGMHRVLSIALSQPVQHINATFTEVAMTTPFTTIDSSATVKDQNGSLISNLSACTLGVTYQDGTTATPSVANAGSGVYTASYNTKGPGTLTELWSFTDVSGAIAQDTRTLIIAY